MCCCADAAGSARASSGRLESITNSLTLDSPMQIGQRQCSITVARSTVSDVFRLELSQEGRRQVRAGGN